MPQRGKRGSFEGGGIAKQPDRVSQPEPGGDIRPLELSLKKEGMGCVGKSPGFKRPLNSPSAKLWVSCAVRWLGMEKRKACSSEVSKPVCSRCCVVFLLGVKGSVAPFFLGISPGVSSSRTATGRVPWG